MVKLLRGNGRDDESGSVSIDSTIGDEGSTLFRNDARCVRGNDRGGEVYRCLARPRSGREWR